MIAVGTNRPSPSLFVQQHASRQRARVAEVELAALARRDADVDGFGKREELHQLVLLGRVAKVDDLVQITVTVPARPRFLIELAAIAMASALASLSTKRKLPAEQSSPSRSELYSLPCCHKI